MYLLPKATASNAVPAMLSPRIRSHALQLSSCYHQRLQTHCNSRLPSVVTPLDGVCCGGVSRASPSPFSRLVDRDVSTAGTAAFPRHHVASRHRFQAQKGFNATALRASAIQGFCSETCWHRVLPRFALTPRQKSRADRGRDGLFPTVR